MLVLSRRPGQQIMIGDDIVLEVLEFDDRGNVRLGIQAPQSVSIARQEVYRKTFQRQGGKPPQ